MKINGWHFARTALPLIILGGAGLFVWSGLLHPSLQAVTPSDQTQDVAIDSEIVVTFSKPVDRSRLVPTITPMIEGEWHYEKGLLGRHLFRQIRFVSQRVLDPNTTYTVSLQEVTGLIATTPVTYTLNFTTRALPEIISLTPPSGANMLSPQAAFTVQLSEPNVGYADFDFSLAPAIPLTVEPVADGSAYLVTPQQPLAQGTEYVLTARRTFVVRDQANETVLYQAEPETAIEAAYTTAPPPSVSAVSPTGDHVFLDLPISVTFSDPMDAASVQEHFQISPETAGELSSPDAKTFTFIPAEPLRYATHYIVTISPGAQTQTGSFTTEPVIVDFQTIGAVVISRLSPSGGATGVDVNSSIHVVFDQAVDHASAEEKITLDPAVSGTFTWSGNEVIFDPTNSFAFDTTYRINVASGIKSEHGLESDREVVATFQTAAQTFLLSIAIDYQDRPLSCEAAALKMALAGKGIKVSETNIMDLIPVSPEHRDGDVWGDPYVEFVGDINGRQNSTGYGVYWDPIASAASQWRPAEAFTGWSTVQVTQEVAKGNPVIAWGVYSGGYRDDWETPTGKKILAWKGEHARTVIGFIGSADNPTKIILNDPNAGRVTWTRQQFEADFAKFGNSGVVVR